MSSLVRSALLLLCMMIGGAAAVAEIDGTLPQEDWVLYKQRFVTDEGRVVDTGNGGISHSEGQGYAMLLAVAFDDLAAFEGLWGWTRSALQVRPEDRLLAWRWEPKEGGGAATDRNSATDGDLLVAWALVRAAAKWDRPEYREAARAILADLRRLALRTVEDRMILLPGPFGFEHEGRVVVNLSYWLFPAFAELSRIDPSTDWLALSESGLDLLARARFGEWDLPPDWLEIGETMRPAPEFEPQFAYNAVRVPLNLVWGGLGAPERLRPFLRYWQDSGRDHLPAWVDLETGAIAPYPADAGTRAVACLVEMAAGRRAANADELPRLDPALDYYPASLVLLVRLAFSEVLAE